MIRPMPDPQERIRNLQTICFKLHTLNQEFDQVVGFLDTYIEDLHHLVAAYPRLSDAHAVLGKWYRSKGEFTQAVIGGHNALAIDAANLSKQAWLGELLRECDDLPALFTEIQPQLLAFHPPYIEIETINVCNAACVMCPASEKERQAKVMPMSMFQKIIDEVALYPVPPNISLHGIGEPLLDRQLAERIAYARERRIPYIAFVSNGSLLTEDKARAVLEAGVSGITVSIESIHPSVYEPIRVNLKLEEVIQNVMRLAQLRDQLRPDLSINVARVTSEENETEEEAFKQFWRLCLRPGLDRVFSFPRHNFAGKYPSPFTPGSMPCSKAFSAMNIRSDGTVPLCCVDTSNAYCFGQVGARSVLELYNAEAFQLVRWRQLAGSRSSLPLCGVCNVPEAGEPSVSSGL